MLNTTSQKAIRSDGTAEQLELILCLLTSCLARG